MRNRPVAVFDSGIGGLTYLPSAMALLPDTPFVYVADHANFPYGATDPDLLRDRVASLVRRIIDRESPCAVLVACNTASVVALADLRSRFSIPFVGVVPAVKPAASLSRNRRIGVLATTRTVEERYLADLVAQFAGHCSVTTVAAGELVTLVENHLGEPPADAAEAVLAPAVQRLRDAAVDTVVLGCTHFIYLLDELRERFGPSVEVVDSREGVARRLAAVVGSAAPGGVVKAHRFYSTAAGTRGLSRLAARFALADEGIL